MVVSFGDWQRGPQMRESIVVCEHRLCRLAGSNRVIDRLIRDAALTEMMRQGCQVRLQVCPMKLLQRFADTAMQADSLGGRRMLVEGLADQRVREAIAPRVKLGYDRQPQCFLNDVAQ